MKLSLLQKKHLTKNYKIIIKAIILILLKLSAFSQTDPIRAEQDLIFQHINKTLIPTGYLKEYVAEVLYKKWLNGTITNTNVAENVEVSIKNYIPIK